MVKLDDFRSDSFSPTHVVARGEDGIVTWPEFLADMQATRETVQGNSGTTDWALFEEDTYRFSVALFALLAENRQVYVPGENTPAVSDTLRALGARCIGKLTGTGTIPVTLAGAPSAGDVAFRLRGGITVFTSGSSGQPSSIAKALPQLDAEVQNLERLWGSGLDDALVLSTVNHQHLYGLLFHVLWPLCAGRAFWRSRFSSPAALMTVAAEFRKTAWIMSPAQLHRMDHALPWSEAGHSARAVFSSGGPLRKQAADLVSDQLSFSPLEVYGSSETGGIAWRRQRVEAEPWTLFPGISARPGENNALEIRSPYLPGRGWYATDDQVEMLADSRFLLGGRLDRIIKIEGKRVSLPAVEQSLEQHPWVSEAVAVPLLRRRQCVGALLTPTDEGSRAWSELGHHRFGLKLREHCRGFLAAAAIPRYWRLADRLPRNEQGKLLHDTVAACFATGRYPAVLRQEQGENRCRLTLFIDPGLPYFKGHFPGMPILPGVVQIYWAEQFARRILKIEGEFLDMRAIKFRNLVPPGTELVLSLEYDAQTGRLKFVYESAEGPHGQGRILFGTNQ